MDILNALKTDGTATSTTLADRLGESTGTLSWHLRLLAEHGFIEEDVERGTKRERWWRAVAERQVLEPSELPGERALGVYLAAIVRQCFDRAERFVSEDWSSEWQSAATLSDWQDLRLSPERLAALNQELLAVVDTYANAPQDPDGSPVSVQIQSFPRR
jgi:DNA-binding transcriptional ArsR family regulator